MVCLSTLAMRRAITCALRRSVSVNAATIEPSCSRQAKSTSRTSRLNRRAASMLARRSVRFSNEKRAMERQPPAILGLVHGPLEVAPKGRVSEQPRLRIKQSVGFEGFELVLEVGFECLNADQRQQVLEQEGRVVLDPH